MHKNDGKNIDALLINELHELIFKFWYIISFQYVACNVPGPDTARSPFAEQFEGCPCADVTSCSNTCPCIARFGPAYSQDSSLALENAESEYQRPVYECNKTCLCSQNCSNRVVQQGVKVPLKVYRDSQKGLAVRAVKPIPKHTFVCEYAGEVLTEEMARIRTDALTVKDHYYIMTLREHVAGGQVLTTYIDPAYIGNVGRFINHSCDPNLLMVTVRVNNTIPKLALFARTDIEADTELTFDYAGGTVVRVNSGVDADNDSGIREEGSPSNSSTTRAGAGVTAAIASGSATDRLRKACACGSKACRGFLPFDASVLAD